MEKNRLYFGDCLEVIQKDSDQGIASPRTLTTRSRGSLFGYYPTGAVKGIILSIRNVFLDNYLMDWYLFRLAMSERRVRFDSPCQLDRHR